MLNHILKAFLVYDNLKQKFWELKYKGSESLSDFIYQKEWNNTKVNRLMHKELSKLTYADTAFLLREQVYTQLIIPLALNLLVQKELKISLYYKDELAVNQRELLRELLLINLNQWDYNPDALFNLKSQIKSNISSISLPQEYVENFIKYQPSQLIWNEDLIKQYSYFITDNSSGVSYAYGLVLNRKRAILNGSSITINSNDYNLEDYKISSIEEFEKYILSSIKIDNELEKRLSAEKAIKFQTTKKALVT